MTTLHGLTSDAASRFRAAGIAPEEANLDAQLLAARVLGWDRTRLITSWRDPAPRDFAPTFEALVARREKREPISQILGRREFWGLEFEVTRDVLTPRPETEGIIEAVKDHCPHAEVIEDIGTGSGCLAVALAKEFPRARLIASDISGKALQVARRNAERHGVADRIAFACIAGSAPPGNVDLIVSNPPYIPLGARDSLPPEVRDHEPPEALFGGDDGLDMIRWLIHGTASAESPRTYLIFECGAGQDGEIRDIIAAESGLELLEFRPDLAGIPRIPVVRRRRYSDD